MAHSHSHHDHAHHDDTHHGDAHERVDQGVRERRLLFAFLLTTITLVAEALGGVISGSLALLADAGHMLVDALALLFAWLGAHFARRPADALRSFGYGRLEVLVGYTNALAQFVLVAWIVVEAVMRLRSPAPILGGVMFWVALAGLVVNLLVLRVLHEHDEHDVNTAGARLHVLGDLLGSLGAVGAALAIRWLGWNWIDPVVSVFVSLLILGNAWRLLRRSGHILLEGVPVGVDGNAVTQALEQAGIGIDAGGVHHVHVWELVGGTPVATLHARIDAGADPDAVVAGAQRVLRERFGIAHATIQIEAGPCTGGSCGSAPA